MNLLVIATWAIVAWLSGLGPRRAPATLHSHLLIAAGKQFLLGGTQRGRFTVSGQNVGPVPVEVREQPRGGSVLPRGLLVPGATARLRFAAGSQARLFNRGAQPAVLELDVTGDTKQLGMTYESVGR